ncbi:MAG: hypothetical protein R2932_07375 [Caldilineaceae bacterium]
MTIAAGASHRCELRWVATEGATDAVTYVVTVDAVGLLNFTQLASDSDVVVVSGPTSAGALRIYIPLVNR